MNIIEHPELPVIQFTSIFGQGQCARSFQLAILWLNALELLEGEGGAMRFACDEREIYIYSVYI